MFLLGKFSVIMPATATLVCTFALATLGDATYIGSFLFFVASSNHLLLSLELSPTNVENVNEPLRGKKAKFLPRQKISIPESFCYDMSVKVTFAEDVPHARGQLDFDGLEIANLLESSYKNFFFIFAADG